MRKFIPILFVLCTVILTSCSSAKRAEMQQKKQQERLQQLEKDKQQFEEKNRKELGK